MEAFQFPCDVCDKTQVLKDLFQTHEASPHDGIQFQEDPDGGEGEPVNEREKRMHL